MKSTPGATLAKKHGMSRVKLAMRVRPTGPLVVILLHEFYNDLFCTES